DAQVLDSRLDEKISAESDNDSKLTKIALCCFRTRIFSQLLRQAGPMIYDCKQEGDPGLACSSMVGPWMRSHLFLRNQTYSFRSPSIPSQNKIAGHATAFFSRHVRNMSGCDIPSACGWWPERIP